MPASNFLSAMATLGNLARASAELRVDVRSHLLATNQARRDAARAGFEESAKEAGQLSRHYADGLVVSDKGRRLLAAGRHSSDWFRIIRLPTRKPNWNNH